MAKEADKRGGRRGMSWRLLGWGTAVLLLLLPLLADAPWTAFDFLLVGALLGSVGLAFEFIVRRSSNLAYRSGAAFLVAAALLTVSVNGAVGMIGPEDNPYNLLFLGVILLGLAGAIVARLEPAGMARAMAVTAIAQGAVGAFGLSADPSGGILSMAFAGLWLLAAALFWKAAREQMPARARQA